MKEIVAALEERVNQMVEQSIFFKFLNDETISATERLARISPCFAYFVLGFRDLQEFVLPYPLEEAKTDTLKQAINDHCKEDSSHWPWFLKDIKTLGLDHQVSFASALKYLWSKETKEQRATCYQFAILTSKCTDPLLKYIFMLGFEINGRALFGKLCELADQSEVETGKELLYYGRTHLARETGGLHGHEELENELLEIELSKEMKRAGLEIANTVLAIQDVEWSAVGKAAYANKKW